MVRKAVKLGLAPVTALAVASINTARHYRRRDMGAVAPGYLADLVIFNELADIRARMVFFHGKLVARDGVMLEVRGAP